MSKITISELSPNSYINELTDSRELKIVKGGNATVITSPLDALTTFLTGEIAPPDPMFSGFFLAGAGALPTPVVTIPVNFLGLGASYGIFV